ncbi:MAG: hypothetical protein EOO41_04115 [Methanobacteriota archaeon]|nr:MAG: hypothetical protein EOO41_04115 [Euryarchaeota archaeon]
MHSSPVLSAAHSLDATLLGELHAAFAVHRVAASGSSPTTHAHGSSAPVAWSPSSSPTSSPEPVQWSAEHMAVCAAAQRLACHATAVLHCMLTAGDMALDAAYACVPLDPAQPLPVPQCFKPEALDDEEGGAVGTDGDSAQPSAPVRELLLTSAFEPWVLPRLPLVSVSSNHGQTSIARTASTVAGVLNKVMRAACLEASASECEALASQLPALAKIAATAEATLWLAAVAKVSSALLLKAYATQPSLSAHNCQQVNADLGMLNAFGISAHAHVWGLVRRPITNTHAHVLSHGHLALCRFNVVQSTCCPSSQPCLSSQTVRSVCTLTL